MKKNISIIGFGATGVSFYCQMVREAITHNIQINISIYSPDKLFGSGYAYGLASRIHRLNTPANLMAIDPSDPKGFSNWCANEPVN